MGDDIQRTLGEFGAKLDALGREMKEVRNDVKEMRSSHDRRASLFDQMKRHLETDTPHEVREGEHAKAFLKWAGVIIVTTIINQWSTIAGFLSK